MLQHLGAIRERGARPRVSIVAQAAAVKEAAEKEAAAKVQQHVRSQAAQLEALQAVERVAKEQSGALVRQDALLMEYERMLRNELDAVAAGGSMPTRVNI